MRTSTLVSYGRWALVLALVLPACANRGMEAPDPDGAGGSVGSGGNASGGNTATGGTPGTGGIKATGGATGTGGTSTGGVPGTGGTSTGGVPGTGGTSTGGVPGTGGTSTGGVPGTGGTSTGGVPGTGGTSTGGVPGTGGVAGGAGTGTGGMAGSAGGAAGKGMAGSGGGGVGGAAGAPATGGSGGHGGASGSGGANVCATSTTLDCTATGALTLAPDGVVTDFSAAQWSPTTMAWCDADGLSGSTFSYGGTGATYAAAVDTTAANLKMNLTVPANGYAGGGILFNACVNASAFTALSFSAVVTSGSLTNCTWLVQLQTQDQRPTTATNPGGGTCNSTTTTCYQSPASPSLAAPTTTGKTYSQAFTTFTGMTAIPMDTQVVGVQWQVNGGASAGCTVELRTDDVKFTP